MTEEATTDPVVVTEPTGEPTAPIVNADGVLREGWKDTLPDDIREEKVFDRVKDFQGAMKSLASAERAFGKDKMAIPNETSTDAEWEAYHKAGGRPDTPQDYNLSVPADLPEGVYTKERLAQIQEFFHKIGLSKKQGDALIDMDVTDGLQRRQSQHQAEELAREEAKSQLYQKWGNAYEQRLHFGRRALDEGTGGNEEFSQSLTDNYGDKADFIEFISNLGAKFTERGSITAANVPTPGDIQKQIDEIIHSDAYTHGSHPGHKQAVQAAAKLFRDRAASTKTG